MTDTTAAAETATTDPAQSSPATTTSDPAVSAPPAATQTASDTDAPWYATLPDDLQKDKNVVKYESPEALVRGHLNALKRFGKDPSRLLEVPEKPDDKKGWDALYSALGRPDSVDGYAIKLPDAATDFDKATFGEFAAKMHAAGASKAQMDVATAEFARAMQVTAEKAQADQAAAAEAGKLAIEKHFGNRLEAYKGDITKLLHVQDAKGDPILTNEEIAALDGDLKDRSLPFLKILAHITDLLAEPESLTGNSNPVTGGALTPYQANAKLSELHGDAEKMKALRDANHPQHKTVLAEREALLKAAYPAQTRAS